MMPMQSPTLDHKSVLNPASSVLLAMTVLCIQMLIQVPEPTRSKE